MARKKGGGHGGGHGWFVTFADLMGLLMAFFGMLTAFSTQDQKKLQLAAGSFREAFGSQKESRLAGIVEMEGLPTRPHMRNLEKVPPQMSSDQTAPRQRLHKDEATSQFAHDRNFALAAASLRQSLASLPELMEQTKAVTIEHAADGLEVTILDADNRSMFPAGSTEPFERTRALVAALAGPLARLPNGIRIVGHATSEAGTRGRLDGWRLSTGRALAVRDILAAGGIAHDRFEAVVGKADSAPLFAEDPSMAANRRVVITLLPATPPAPPKN